MKSLLIVSLCLAALLTAGSAQAYAIYNHVDHEVCIQTIWTQILLKNCKYTIPAHGKHNGGHGDKLSHVYAVYRVKHGDKCCRCNPNGFSIPHGGYARIYPEVVKVYKHNGDHVEDKTITGCDCDCE